jgi:hypothetical protein
VDEICSKAAATAASESAVSSQTLLIDPVSKSTKAAANMQKVAPASSAKPAPTATSSSSSSSSQAWRLITDNMLDALDSISKQIEELRRDFSQRHKFVHRALAQLIAQSPNLPSTSPSMLQADFSIPFSRPIVLFGYGLWIIIIAFV